MVWLLLSNSFMLWNFLSQQNVQTTSSYVVKLVKYSALAVTGDRGTVIWGV